MQSFRAATDCFSFILPLFPLAFLYNKAWTWLSNEPASFWKIWKCHFFQDIQNSFQWATGIGLEPHQNFFWKKNPTNTVARAVQSFGWNGPLLAGWFSNGKNFFVNLAQTLDEQTLKISRRLLDSYLIHCWLTDLLLRA